MFPLISIIGVAAFVFTAGELYAPIIGINAVAFLLCTYDVSDFLLWFLVFEFTVLTAVSFLTLESRSYRRTYAMVVMLALALLSSVAIYSVISMSVSSVSSLSSAKSVVGLSWFAVILALLVVFVKVPSWPFSVWLPEAHVEASWGGSVVLAGYALKFATIALLLFGSTRFTTMDPAVTLLGFSVVFSTLAICSTFDSKKVVANLSIIHMSATGILLLSCSGSQSDFLLGLSWHHHSIVTGATFLLIGWTYAVSGSRVFRFLVVNPASSVIFLTLYFAILTMSLDLPWTPNVLVEISFVKIISSTGNLLVLASLVVFFLVVILGFIKIATGLSKRSTAGLGGMSDLSVSRIAVVVVSSILIVAIGFGLGN